MNINFSKLVKLITVSLCFILIAYAIWSTNEREKDIEKNKYETIAKVIDFKSNRSFDNYSFVYNYKNKVYEDYDDLDYFEEENCIGRYYKVAVSIKNPHYSKIYLDQEITDTLEIIKAGFKLNEEE